MTVQEKAEKFLKYFFVKDGSFTLKHDTPFYVWGLVTKCTGDVNHTEWLFDTIVELLDIIRDYASDCTIEDMQENIHEDLMYRATALDWAKDYFYYVDEVIDEGLCKDLECALAVARENCKKDMLRTIVEYLRETEFDGE